MDSPHWHLLEVHDPLGRLKSNPARALPVSVEFLVWFCFSSLLPLPRFLNPVPSGMVLLCPAWRSCGYLSALEGLWLPGVLQSPAFVPCSSPRGWFLVLLLRECFRDLHGWPPSVTLAGRWGCRCPHCPQMPFFWAMHVTEVGGPLGL